MPTAEVIEFPDAEAVAIAYLNAELSAIEDFAAVKAGTTIPNPRPTAFVRVLRTGGVPRDIATDSPQLTFEAWSDDELRAIAIAQRCQALVAAASMQGFMGDTVVYDWNCLTGPSNIPDPTTQQIRYRFTGGIDMRGDVVA